jgi:hypothetical protein
MKIINSLVARPEWRTKCGISKDECEVALYEKRNILKE